LTVAFEEVQDDDYAVFAGGLGKGIGERARHRLCQTDNRPVSRTLRMKPLKC
jgi:hypothetical protein